MAETLVIRLRAAPEAPASWLIVDANGARSGPARSGAVAEALPFVGGRRVLLLVPGSEVTLAEPELPLRGGARVTQAVPFALEEHLASDVEALHFAIGNRTDSAIGTPVAAVARGLMDRWSETCLSAGVVPQAAYADSAVVPFVPHGCTLLLDESALYVRRADAMPFVLDAEPLATALDIALGPPADETDPREHVSFFVSPMEYEANRELIEGLRPRTASLQVKLMTEGALPVLAAQAVDTNAVNLLQGTYAPRRSINGGLHRWRVPVALAAACLLAFVAVQALSLWKPHVPRNASTRRSPRCFNRRCRASRSSIRARRCRVSWAADPRRVPCCRRCRCWRRRWPARRQVASSRRSTSTATRSICASLRRRSRRSTESSRRWRAAGSMPS